MLDRLGSAVLVSQCGAGKCQVPVVRMDIHEEAIAGSIARLVVRRLRLCGSRIRTLFTRICVMDSDAVSSVEFRSDSSK